MNIDPAQAEMHERMLISMKEKHGTMKIIGTCKECKWASEYGFGCQHKKFEYNSNPSYLPADGAKARNVNDWAFRKFGNDLVSISTGPDFGCIHWEEK